MKGLSRGRYSSRSVRVLTSRTRFCFSWILERTSAALVVASLVAVLVPTVTSATDPGFQDEFPTHPNAFSNTTAASFNGGLIIQYTIEGYFDGSTNVFRCYQTDPYAPQKTTNEFLFPPAGVNWNQGPVIPALDGACCAGDQGYVDDNGRVCMTLTDSSTHTIEACVDCSTPADTVVRDVEVSGTKISPRLARINDRLVAMVFDFVDDKASFYSRAFNGTSWFDMKLSVPCDSPFSGRHGDLTSIPSGTHAFSVCYNGNNVDVHAINAVDGTLIYTHNLGVAGPPGLNFEYADGQYCPNLQHNLAFRFGNASQGTQKVGMAFDVCDVGGPSNITSLDVPIGAPGDVFGLSCQNDLAQVRMSGPSWSTFVGNYFFGDGSEGPPLSDEHFDTTSGVNFANAFDPVGTNFQPIEHTWGRQPYAETYTGSGAPRGEEQGPPAPTIRFGAMETPIFFHDFETGDARYWSGIQGQQ